MEGKRDISQGRNERILPGEILISANCSTCSRRKVSPLLPSRVRVDDISLEAEPVGRSPCSSLLKVVYERVRTKSGLPQMHVHSPCVVVLPEGIDVGVPTYCWRKRDSTINQEVLKGRRGLSRRGTLTLLGSPRS